MNSVDAEIAEIIGVCGTGDTCCRCGSGIARGEARVVVSSKALGHRALPMNRRMLCASCFMENHDTGRISFGRRRAVARALA